MRFIRLLLSIVPIASAACPPSAFITSHSQEVRSRGEGLTPGRHNYLGHGGGSGSGERKCLYYIDRKEGPWGSDADQARSPQKTLDRNMPTTTPNAATHRSEMKPLEAAMTKLGMMTYIASMCISLPLTLLPLSLLYESRVISKTRLEEMALETGQVCAKSLLRIIPFVDLNVISSVPDEEEAPEPSIWVCNHTSMLDVFILLAVDQQLRGQSKRPIKTVYWKGLDDNPFVKLLFQMSGFIPVQMSDNGNGNPNEYDVSSFKSVLRETKKAFEDGFDMLIFPEGQLNPWPENGLLEVFPGAFKLARMSRRPIRMVAMHGLHRLWHPDESIGMTVTGRDVSVRAYPEGRIYDSDEEFLETFRAVVGHFGATGEDLPDEELEKWLDGRAWREKSEG